MFLFGIAPVPITHLVHSILGTTKIETVARRILDKFAVPAAVPVLA